MIYSQIVMSDLSKVLRTIHCLCTPHLSDFSRSPLLEQTPEYGPRVIRAADALNPGVFYIYPGASLVYADRLIH